MLIRCCVAVCRRAAVGLESIRTTHLSSYLRALAQAARTWVTAGLWAALPSGGAPQAGPGGEAAAAEGARALAEQCALCALRLAQHCLLPAVVRCARRALAQCARDPQEQ